MHTHLWEKHARQQDFTLHLNKDAPLTWHTLTFLFPGDDLGVGAREEEVELQWNVIDQVLQDGGLLATFYQKGGD